MAKIIMSFNSTPNHSDTSISPGLIHDVLTGFPATWPQIGRDIRPVTDGIEKVPDHSAIFIRKCVVSDTDYSGNETPKQQAVLQNSMVDADTSDLLDLLLAGVVSIRARQESSESEATAQCFTSDSELITYRDITNKNNAYSQLLEVQDQEAVRGTIGEYIEAYAQKGMHFGDGCRVSAILSFYYDDNNPAVAAQAFRCGSTLILSLPNNANIADSCVRILIGNAESTAQITDTWTVTYQQLFDSRFEISPFANPITPETPFKIQVISNKDAKYCSTPCLLRDRITNDLLAWVREEHYEADLSVIHQELATEKEKQQKEQDHCRHESAWKMIQCLVSEELTQEFNAQERTMLAEEVGEERSEAIRTAAKTIASLFPIFLRP